MEDVRIPKRIEEWCHRELADEDWRKVVTSIVVAEGHAPEQILAHVDNLLVMGLGRQIAYGPRDEARVQTVPREAIPDHIPTDPGTQLSAQMQDGQTEIKVQPDKKPDFPKAEWPYSITVYACDDGVKAQEIATTDPRIIWND